MSIRIMNIVFETDMLPKDKIVLLALADHADAEGYCFPGQGTLSRRSSIPERTLRRILQRLEDAGFITRERRQTENGQRKTDGYQLSAILTGGSGPTGQNEQPYRPTVAGTYSNEPPEEPSDIHEPSSDDVLFENLWAAWPRKNDKIKARKSWLRLSAAERIEALPLLVAHANAHRANTPPQFIPYLATVLNNKAWTNPLAVSRERGAYKAEPQAERKPFTIPAGHILVRDEMTGAITGTRPA